jgi:bifunctional DNA-binding transcriptional regulator/antitoxin component of YhaV-PrlF toxin-antitoxin module
MARVGSRRRITIPRALAEQYGLRVGQEVEFEPAGEAIRLVPMPVRPKLSIRERLELFDASVARQRERERLRGPAPPVGARDWTREELYGRRGRARP